MMKPLITTCFLLITFIATAEIICGQHHPPSPADSKSSTNDKSPADAAAKYFPNTELITQDNQKVKFYEDLLKDKFVLINFMFTTCQAICPPMTANLSRVQSLLGEQARKQVTLISISVDPTTDTPERLKEYANKFKAQPGWYFLTGEKQNVELVSYKLGGFVKDKNEHNAIIIVGNVRTGEWAKMYALAKPSEIVAKVNQMLTTADSKR
jgi:protein SCO1/2